MKKTALISAFAVILGFLPSAWGLGINVGSVQKDYTHYGTAESRESLSISTQNWNSAWTPVEVNFYKGDDTGEFYFTTFSLNQTNDVLSTLNCDGVALDFNSWMKVQGYLNATNTSITATYLRIASGGVLDMDGGKLALTGDRTDLGAVGSGDDLTYQITGKMTLNNVEFSAAGSITASTASGQSGEIVFSGITSFTGTELIAKNGGSLSLLDNATVHVDSLTAAALTVSDSARVTVSSASALDVDSLNLVLDGVEPLYFADIFKTDDGTSVVFSAISTDITVMDRTGKSYDNVLFAYDDSGNITGVAAVPEPSTYAALFGVIALAFAAYRRRN